MLSGSHLAGLIHLFLLPGLQYFLHHCLTHFSASHAAVCSYVYLNDCLVFMHMVTDSSCVDFLETN